MKITISGDLGSGKSTIGKAIAQKWDYNFYSTGTIFRELAAKKGLDVVQGNKAGEVDRSFDDEVDATSTNIGKTENNFIFDSRLAWHFIPDSFSLYLYCDPKIAAKRIFSANRSEEQTRSIDEMLASNMERRKSELKRYQSLYGINLIDLHNYDLVLDTSHNSADELIEWVIVALETRRSGVYLTHQTIQQARELEINLQGDRTYGALTEAGWQISADRNSIAASEKAVFTFVTLV